MVKCSSTRRAEMMKLDTLSLNLMNTNFYVAIPEGIQKNWKERVEKWLRYVATEWSRFQDNNELSKLNQLKVGETLQLSSALYDCLERANHYYTISNGLFSPYLKLQLEQHGYNRSFPFIEAKGTDREKASPLNNTSQPILFLYDNLVLKTGEQQVDLGGFAKGYAVEKIAEWLQQEVTSEYGIVDGGGDMKMWSSGKKDWTIGIVNPYNEKQELTYVKMKTGAIATSNRVYRSWNQGGQTKHHLLNGQTGEIAKSDVVQATVVANSLCEAEVGTKICFLLDEKEQQKWFENNQIQSARFIVKENEKGYWIKARGKEIVN